MPYKETELSYLAGLIDGEGCFLIRRVGTSLQARVTIANTAKSVMDWLKNTFGGCWWETQRPEENHKNLFTWEMSGKLIQKLLPQIFPYLIIKQEPAKIILEFLSTLTRSCKLGLSQEVRDHRVNLKEQLVKTR